MRRRFSPMLVLALALFLMLGGIGFAQDGSSGNTGVTTTGTYGDDGGTTSVTNDDAGPAGGIDRDTDSVTVTTDDRDADSGLATTTDEAGNGYGDEIMWAVIGLLVLGLVIWMFSRPRAHTTVR